MRVLLTRPLEDSRSLAETLRARGVEILIEPMLFIHEIGGDAVDLAGVQAILVTSANGARALAARTERRDLRVLAVGEGSAEAARKLGFIRVESAAGDTQGLAALARERLSPGDGALFHAAGSTLAGDLKGDLERDGFEVRRAKLYEARAADEFSAATRAELSRGLIDCVLLFSPRTARIFATLWRKAGSPPLGTVTALCLSPAAAREIGDGRWLEIRIAGKPDLPSMLALVDAERERIASMAEEKNQPQSSEVRVPAPAVEAPTVEAPTVEAPTVETPSVETVAGNPDAAPAEAAQAGAPREGGGGGRTGLLFGALIAGAMGGIAVGAAGPYWMPALGLGGAGAPGVSAGQLAAIEQTLRDKPGAADILAATDPLRRQLDDTRAELETARQDVADLRVALESLQLVAAAAPETAATGSVDLAPVMSRLETLESTLASTQARVDEAAVAQAAPAQIAEAARQTLEAENRALRDRIDELARSIAETASLAPRIEDVEARLDEVPAQTLRQRRAALIVALGQLQSALTDDGAFAPELRTVQDIAVDDQAMWDRLGPLVEVLAPLAEAGVPTRSQLAAGFPGTAIARSAEADLAGSLIADAPWWKRLMHRVSEVVTVRPVGGDVEGDGPLERLARAEADLLEGDLAASVREVEGITGSAADTAAQWLEMAKARIAIDEAAAALAELSARALAPAPGGAG
jgi:uroporphyrinogen-III synthase